MDRRLEQWTTEVAADLNITDAMDEETITSVLDMTRDVAHGVDRPAGPLTAYLLGVAVGRGADHDQVTELVTGRAKGWQPDDSDDVPADEAE